MDVVKRNVADMEVMVERAEAEVGSVSSVKKVFQLLKLPLFGAAVSCTSLYQYDFYVYIVAVF